MENQLTTQKSVRWHNRKRTPRLEINHTKSNRDVFDALETGRKIAEDRCESFSATQYLSALIRDGLVYRNMVAGLATQGKNPHIPVLDLYHLKHFAGKTAVSALEAGTINISELANIFLSASAILDEIKYNDDLHTKVLIALSSPAFKDTQQETSTE